MSRSLIADIAAILVFLFVMSLIAVVVSAIGGLSAADSMVEDMVSNALNEIPLCQNWIDLLFQWKDAFYENPTVDSIISQSGTMMAQGVFQALFSSFLEAFLIALCIRVANTLMRGRVNGKVFPTLVGVVIGCLLCGVGGFFSRDTLYIIHMVLIMMVGISLIVIGKFQAQNSGLVIGALLILLDAVVTVVLAMYASALYLVVQRVLQPAVVWALAAAVISILVMVAAYFLSNLLEGLSGEA